MTKAEDLLAKLDDCIDTVYPDYGFEWDKKEALAVINSTLAAERETYGKASDMAQAEIERLKGGWNMRVRRIEELKQQLDAERDWSQHLRVQLAAEVEKVNKLHDQLAAEEPFRADKWQAALEAAKYPLHKQLAAKQKELERERMCHSACGVIAMSNTPKSLAENRAMLPEYLSASVQDCIRAAEREIELRRQLTAEQKKYMGALGAAAALTDDIMEVHKQLAAEREKSRVLGNIIDGKGGLRDIIREHQAEYDRLSAIIKKDTLRIVELEEQLAAERKRVKVLEDGTALNAIIKVNDELRRQLSGAITALEVFQQAPRQDSQWQELRGANKAIADALAKLRGQE